MTIHDVSQGVLLHGEAMPGRETGLPLPQTGRKTERHPILFPSCLLRVTPPTVAPAPEPGPSLGPGGSFGG